MKKILILAVLAATFAGCGGKDKYVVEGDIPGLEGTVYLFQRNDLADSALVTAGKFRFEGRADSLRGVCFLIDSREGYPRRIGMPVILEPGKIKVGKAAEDSTAFVATGTPSNDAYAAYERAGKRLIAEYRQTGITDERREQIEDEFEELSEKSLERNRDNYLGVMLLSDRANTLSGQELLDEIAAFTPEMQQAKEMIQMKTLGEQMLKTDIGQAYTDIVQNNAAGEPVSLRSVVDNPANKYVLLDFWASWCGPCMGEVPHLKQTYEKFHKDGFEIYGVSFDDDRANWLEAVDGNEMAWIHVSDLQGFDNPAAKAYAVQGIPSNFLIETATGKIVAKQLRGEALYEKIGELLGE